MEVDNPFDTMSSDRLLSATLFIRPPGDNNAILIVEGGTDIKFYNPFVCDEKYLLQPDTLIDINGGKKDKVIEAIKKANEEGMKGIVGIVDADFDNLNNVPFVENLYRTDTHDLESMLLKSEKSLKKVLDRYCNADNLIPDTHISSIQNILLDISKYIGYALWCSNECQWMIDFEGFPINKFIDEKCDFDLKEACIHLKRKSSDNTLSLKDIELEVTQKVSEKWDLWQVCRGKEMLRVLAEYIRHNIRSGTYSGDNLRDDFLLAFDNEDFMNTKLYVSMKDWEQKNRNYSIIKF
ncbi:MAG: DUF4435 domain-containing protein [Alphaproteobacteria bacterium]|nr:DUF4435 domain-containing protein [Alphaproteobacteria bacterium]